MFNLERIGKNIAFYRKRAGLTQKELAKKLNLTYQAVSKWECGKSCPEILYLDEIANALNTSILELLGDSK